MTTWLSNSATSNKLKQTYVRGFIDVSGDVIIRNNNELNFYDNNTATKNFSINSQEISVYENGSYIDISNTKLTYIKDLSENVQLKLNEFQSKLGDISHNIDTDYAVNIVSSSNLVQINDSLKTNSIEANADVSLNNNVFIGGTTSVSGDIIPTVGSTFNLGSENNPFGSLYISNNTIFFQGDDNESSGSMKFDAGDITILKRGDPESNRKKLTTSTTSNKLGVGKDSREAEADLDVSGDTILRGNLTVSDNLTVDGTLTANYSDNSIPVAAIDGNLGLIVSTIKGDTADKIISDVNVLRFDTDSGFDIDDLSNGAVKVKMNSTFKTWKVDGQQDLVAEGLDSMTLVAGDNVVLTTYQDPKSLEIGVDFSNVDTSLNLKANKREVDASFNLKSDTSYVDASLNLKSDTTYVDASLNLKSDTTYVDASLNLKSDTTYVDTSLNLKSDTTYVDASLNLKLPETNPNVKGNLTVEDGDVSFNKNLNVGGDTTLNGDLSIHGNLSVFQTENNKIINTTVNNYELIVSEDLSLNGNLSVSNNSVFNKNVDICGNLYAQYPANSIPLFAISDIESKANQTYVDASLNLKADQTYVDASLNLKSDQTYVDASLNLKSDQTYVDASLNLKSDQTYVDASLNLKADKTYVDASLNLKADQTYVDASLNLKSDQTYVDASLNLKSDQTYVDASLNLKLPESNPTVIGDLTLSNGDMRANNNIHVFGNSNLYNSVNVSESIFMNNANIDGSLNINDNFYMDDVHIPLISTKTTGGFQTESENVIVGKDTIYSPGTLSNLTLSGNGKNLAFSRNTVTNIGGSADAIGPSEYYVQLYRLNSNNEWSKYREIPTPSDKSRAVIMSSNYDGTLLVLTFGSHLSGIGYSNQDYIIKQNDNNTLGTFNGTYVDINKEGDKIVVSNDNGNKVYQYISPNNWSLIGSEITDSNNTSAFFYSHLNAKGDIFVTIGTNSSNIYYLSVYKYDVPQDSWIKLGSDILSSSDSIKIDSISISSLGYTVAYTANDITEIYTYNGSDWVMKGNQITKAVSKNIINKDDDAYISLFKSDKVYFYAYNKLTNTWYQENFFEGDSGSLSSVNFDSSKIASVKFDNNLDDPYSITITNRIVEKEIIHRYVTTDTLKVSNDASFNSRVDICGNFYAQYPDETIPISAIEGGIGINVNNDLSLNAGLIVAEDVSLNSTLRVSDTTSLSSNLIVEGDASFNSDIAISGNLTMDGTLKVRETQNIMNTVVNNYEVIITNDLSLNGNLNVTKDSSFNGNVTVDGFLNAQYPSDSIPSSALIDFDTKADKTYVDSSLNLKVSNILFDSSLNLKANTTYVDASLNLKADKSYVNNLISESNSDVTTKADLTYVDASLNLKSDITYVDASLNLKSDITDVDASLNLKSDITVVDASLNLKSDITYVDASLNLKSDKTYVDASLNLKTDITYVDASLNLKSDITYVDNANALKSDQTYVDASLNLKADKSFVNSSLNLKSDQTYVDASLNLKADQTYVDSSLNLKSDQTYVVSSLNLKADKTYIDSSLNLKSDQTYVDASLNLKLPISNPIVDGLLTVNNGDVSLNQNLNVGGNTRLDGDLSIHGNLSVFQTENNTVINTTVNNYDLIVSEDLSLNGELSVKDNASFNKNVTIAGNLNAQYPNDSIPLTAIDNIEIKADKTYVDSALSLKSDQTYVDNSLNLKLPISNPSVQGNLVVSNNATISGNTIINGSTTTIDLSASGTTTLTRTNIDSSLNINSDINIDGMNFDIFKRKSTRGFNIVNVTDITHTSDYWNSNSTFSKIIMAGDGKTIAYKASMLSGAPTSDFYIKIFKLDNNNDWTFITDIATTLSNAKLNFDGTRLIVSDSTAYYTSSNYPNAGVIYIYNTDTGSVVETNWGSYTGAKYGIKSAISGNGQSYVFTSTGLYDIHHSGGTSYTDPDNTNYDYQFIAINYDGSIFAGTGANNGNFFIRVLSYNNNSIVPIGSAIYNSNFNDRINNIYLSQSGNAVAVTTNENKTFIYTYTNNSWTQKGSTLSSGKVVFDKDDNDYIRIVSGKVYFYHYYYNEWTEESSLTIDNPGDCDEYGLMIASSYYNSSNSQGYVKVTQRDINTHLHQGYINVKDLEVTNSLKYSGDISFNNRVDICGNLYAQYPDNSIPTSAIDGNIGIDTETDISLNANLNVGGNTRLDSTLTVKKAVDFASTLSVDGDVSLNSNLSLSGDMVLNGNLTMDGDLTMDGTLSVRQTQSVMNTVVNNYEVIITNDLSLNGDMSISGDASFQNNVDICGNLYAQYPNESIPSSAIIGGITGVDKNIDLDLHAGFSVIGDSSFSYVNIDNSMNVTDLFVDGSMVYNDIVLPINKEYELLDTYSISSFGEITNNGTNMFEFERIVFSGDGSCVAYQYSNNVIYIFKKDTNNNWNFVTQIAESFFFYRMGINYDGTRIIGNNYAYSDLKGIVRIYNTDTGATVNSFIGLLGNYRYGMSSAISGDGNVVVYSANDTYKNSVVYVGYGIDTTYTDTYNSDNYRSVSVNYNGLIFAGITYDNTRIAILKNNNGTITQLGQHIVKTALYESDTVGLKLSDDGYAIMFNSQGSIYIYQYINNNWSQKGSALINGRSFTFNKDTTDSLQIHAKPNIYSYHYENNSWVLTRTVDIGSYMYGFPDQHGLNFAADQYIDGIYSIKITSRDERNFILHEYSDTKDLRVRGKTIIDGSLNVVDDASFNGRVDICGNFYAQYPDSSIPPSAIDGVLGMDYNADISLNANMVVDGTTNLNSLLNVNGPTTLSSTLNVSNSTTLSSTLNVSKAASLSSTLYVSNATTLNSTLLVRKDATFDTNANIKGNLIVDGDLSVRQTNSIMNTVVNNYEVIITNDLSLNGNAVISGDASFNGRVDICGNLYTGNLYAQYPDSSIPLSALNGTVNIDTNADLSLNADAYFKGKLSVFSDVSLNGDSIPIPGTDYTYIPIDSNVTYLTNVSLAPGSNAFPDITLGSTTFIDERSIVSTPSRYLLYAYYNNNLWNVNSYDLYTYSFLFSQALDNGNYLAGLQQLNDGSYQLNIYRRPNPNDFTSPPNVYQTTISIEQPPSGSYYPQLGVSVYSNKLVDLRPVYGNTFYVYNVNTSNHSVSLQNSVSIPSTITYNNISMNRGSVCSKRQSLAMSGDGNVIAFSTSDGIVTYKYSTGVWSVNGLIVIAGSLAYFSLNNNGTSLIIKVGYNTSIVYKYIDNNWVEKLTYTDGTSVAQANKDHIVVAGFTGGPNKLDKIYNYINGEYVVALSNLASQYSTTTLFSNPSGTQFFRFDRNGTFNSLTIDDAETRYEYVDTQSKLYVSGDASFNESIDVSGNATFHNRVDICGNLYAQYPDNSIPSSAIIGGSTGVNPFEDTSFNSNVDVCGNFYAQYPDSSIPPSAIIGGVLGEGASFNPTTDDLSLNNNFYVNGDASLNSNLYVDGSSSFNSDISIKGLLTATNDISLNGVTPIPIPGTDHYRLTSDYSNIALTAYNIPQASSVNYSVRFVDKINYSRFTYVNGSTIYYVKKNTDGTWQRDTNASTLTNGVSSTKYVFSPDGQCLIAWFENSSNSYKWDIGIFDATTNTQFDRSTDILYKLSSSLWDTNSEYLDMAISVTSTYTEPLFVVATKSNTVKIYRFLTNQQLSSTKTITPPSVSSVNFNYPEQTPGFDFTNHNNNYFGMSTSLNEYRVAISNNGRVIFISVRYLGVYIYRDFVYTTTIRGYNSSYDGGIDTYKPIRVNEDGTIFALNGINGSNWTVHRYNETDDVWYQLGDPISGEIKAMNKFGNIIIVDYKVYTFNFITNVWEVTSNLDQTHHTDINDIGNMIVYRGPSQIPEDTNNSLVGILEAPSYTTEYINSVNFKQSNLFVNGDVSINYNLNVGSDASFGNDVDICGNLTIGNNVIIDGELQVRKTESVMNTIVNNYEVIITNDFSLNGDFTVNGNSTFNNRVDIYGNLYAQYPDSSIPRTAITGGVGLDTESDISLNANLSVGGNASFNTNSFFIQNVTYDPVKTRLNFMSSTFNLDYNLSSHAYGIKLSGDGNYVTYLRKMSTYMKFLIYNKDSNGNWNQQYYYNISDWGTRYNDNYGHGTAINEDGSIAAFEISSTRLIILKRTNTSWTLQQQIDFDFANRFDWLGRSCSFNSAGDALIIGGYENSGNGTYSGVAKIYYFTNNIWSQIGSDIYGQSAQDKLGFDCVINDTSDIVAVSAPFSGTNGTHSGYVAIYQLVNNQWSPLGSPLYGQAAGDNFGRNIEITRDGLSLAIRASANSVKFYSYDITNNIWSETPKSLDYDQSWMASNKTLDVVIISSNSRGSLCVYQYDTTSWNLIAEYTPAIGGGSTFPVINYIGNVFAYREYSGGILSIDNEIVPVEYPTKLDISTNFHLVEGDASFNNALYVGGATTTSSIDITNDASISGNASVSGTITVSNNASFNSRVDICGNLYAQYPDNSIPVSALDGNVGVDTESDLSLNAKLSIGNDASFNANVSVLGDLTVDGTLQVRNTESIMNTIVNNYEVIITNDLSLNSDLTIGGDASFNSNITVLGDSSFNGRVDICGNFYAQYPDNSIPASAIIGGVSSGGNQSVSNLAFGDGNKIIGVTDDVTFDDDDFALIKESDSVNPILDISANLYVSGDVSFNNGSVLIPTPLTTDISNTAINIGYLEGMGYITASGLLRQFEP